MWRKPEDNKLKSSSGASDSAVPSLQPLGVAEAPELHLAPSTVKPGIVIKGEISGQGDFLLDGGFEGRVCLAEGTFSVGSNAHVNAEVEAREIVIRGEFTGTLKARERIQILSTAKVTGDMDTRGIMIEDGAVLHSRVAIPQPAVHAEVPNKDDSSRHSHPETAVRKKGAAVAGPGPASPQDAVDH